MATIKGTIKAISISKERGRRKDNIPEAEFKVDFGIVGDAHAEAWHRQISLLAKESIDKMRAKGANVKAGDFAENITTEGINLCSLSLGDILRLGGDVEVEITQFGKKCHHGCEILKLTGDCIMPLEGIFAKVIRPGRVRAGDAVEVIND